MVVRKRRGECRARGRVRTRPCCRTQFCAAECDAAAPVSVLGKRIGVQTETSSGCGEPVAVLLPPAAGGVEPSAGGGPVTMGAQRASRRERRQRGGCAMSEG